MRFVSEIEYRIKCLQGISQKLSGKKIALYGTGNDARCCIEQIPELSVCALIDEKRTGQFFGGLKVVSLEETLALGIETIIIAANVNSSLTVSYRITKFCLLNSIELYNMYGVDEINRKRVLLTQQINYPRLTSNKLIEQIREHSVICFQNDNIIAGSEYVSNRMIEIVNNTVESGKKVFIFYDKINVPNAINGKCQLVNDSEDCNLSNGILRLCMGEIKNERVLFIGSKQKYWLFLAQNYGFDICIVKSPWEIAYQFARNITDEERKENSEWYNRFVCRYYASPFFCDIKEPGMFETKNLLELKWRTENWEEMHQKLIPSLDDPREDCLEKLVFLRVSKPVVSIIIPAHNHLDYTYNCLKSILKIDSITPYEIIVVDDKSNDATCHIENIVNGITVIHNDHNLQFIRSCNKAAERAKGDYLLFLNSDTQVMDGWMDSLIEQMKKDDRTGIVGSMFIYPDGRLQEAGGIIWSDGSADHYGWGEDYKLEKYNYSRAVDYISGASIMIKTSVWKAVGGFSEEFAPAYCEDTDIAMKVRALGYNVIFQPESIVVHFENISNGKNASEYVERNKDIFYRKWRNELRDHYHPGTSMSIACERKIG